MPPLHRRLVDSPVLPVALVALFAVLILLNIHRFSTWIDESASVVVVATNSYAELVRRVQYDSHPPLWYVVLKPALQMFGNTVDVSRAEQAVFMLAGIGVWYQLVRTRFSRPLALLALLLIVTNPMMLHYAIEGRMYAFCILLTGIACLLVTSTWRWRWFAYWPCAVVMLYTHYFLSFVVAGQFVFLWLERRERGVSTLWLILYGASIIAAFTPWVPNAFRISSLLVTTGFWVQPVSPSSITGFVEHAFLHRLESDFKNAHVFPALLFFAAFGSALVRAARAKPGPYALLWCIVVVPCLGLLVISCKIPVFYPRYLVFGLPALITLLAAGALTLRGRWRVAIVAVLVVGQLWGYHMLRMRGFTDTRGFWSMKQIAPELGRPIGGELPTVVSTWWMPFFDARASLPEEQPVLLLRSSFPRLEFFPDTIYYDRPTWWTFWLGDIRAHHVWLIENVGDHPADVPPSWHLEVTHAQGYVRYRLFTVSDSTAASGPPRPSDIPAR